MSISNFQRNSLLRSCAPFFHWWQTDGVSCKFTFFLFQMEEAALVRSSTVSSGSAGGAASSGFGGGGKSSKVGGRSSHKASKSHSFLSRDSHSGSSTSLSKAVKSGSSSAAAAAQNMIQKTGNSVRARLMKMSLHTDSSQCWHHSPHHTFTHKIVLSKPVSNWYSVHFRQWFTRSIQYSFCFSASNIYCHLHYFFPSQINRKP